LLIDLPTININIEDKKSLTPLHVACKFCHEDVAELLIQNTQFEKLHYLQPEAHSNNSTSLHFVCRYKKEKYQLAKLLLDKIEEASSSEANTKKINFLDIVLRKYDSSGSTPLLSAVENNHLKITELLLCDYNADKEQCDNETGNHLIHIAARTGSIDMFNLLVKYDAVSLKKNKNSQNPLHIAAYYSRHNFIKAFLEYEHEHCRKVREQMLQCICGCDPKEDEYIPCIKQRDNVQCTPLMIAISTSNQKCVEELLANENVELDARDMNGNSIFHICIDSDNPESLKYLTANYQTDVIFNKNNADETVVHSSCRNGNLEMVKMVLNKIYESNEMIEPFLYSKNKSGQTCFHIACSKGYDNVVEHFLKERKLNAFVEHTDNNANTALHLATMNGSSTIVQLLLDHGADMNVKNEENNSALDLSCRQGYFEISKNLITNYTDGLQLKEEANKKETSADDNLRDYPLHVACIEGAAEVVELLLSKNAVIDKLDDQKQNCLDIAISREHREVIRVLLNDPNWSKLFRINTLDDIQESTNVNDLSIVVIGNEDERKLSTNEDDTDDEDKYKIQKTHDNTKYIENPQLVALYEHKMWDMLKIVLDNCVSEERVDLTKIDPPGRTINNHPLMLIARSGQEALLKHETTRVLLQLKWRYIPRSAFYFNLLFYMIFMLFFSLYCIEISNYGRMVSMNIDIFEMELEEEDERNYTQNEIETKFLEHSKFYNANNFGKVLNLIQVFSSFFFRF
jgi:ankyrin repeat protein